MVDVEPARVESDTHAGVDASLQPLRTADFVLQLVSVLLILLFLTLALYIAYKRRRLLKMKRFSDFGTQTDSEVGAREDLDRVIKAVSNLQHQVLTLGLEQESVRRLNELKRNASVSQSPTFLEVVLVLALVPRCRRPPTLMYSMWSDS